MYCNRCNLEFPEGLRFCKWCGQGLSKSRRVTSELIACPNCAAAVQPTWTYCKACGAKLTQPVHAHAGTAVIAHCSTCGEKLEPNSAYCKACGSVVEPQATPFGASSLLCPACNSHNPLGSTACRVCGEALPYSPQDEAEPEAEKKSSTLPDLQDKLPAADLANWGENTEGFSSASVEEAIESGAQTLVFTAPSVERRDEREEPAEATAAKPPEPPEPSTATEVLGEGRPGGTVETTMLPGGPGNSDQSASTTMFKQGRITSPVDDSPTDLITNDPELIQTIEQHRAPVTVQSEQPFFYDEGGNREHSPKNDQSGTESIHTPVIIEGQQPPVSTELPKPNIEFGEVYTAPFGMNPPPAEPEAPAEFETVVIDPSREAEVEDRILRQQSISYADPAANSEAVQPEVMQAAPQKKTALTLVSVAVTLFVLVAAAYFAYRYIAGGGPEPQRPPQVATEPPQNTPPAPAPKPDNTPKTPVAPEGMVYVPAGNYVIGTNDPRDELGYPPHSVQLAPFFIDATEVTNAAYKKFVDATGRRAPDGWSGGSYKAGQDDWPVTGVTWQDASDYASWAGKRLPSEEEWEAAARGTDGRRYPWGEGWQSGYANIGTKGIQPVGQFRQGASPFGAMDMIGNVWEWTADELTPYPGSTATLSIKRGVTYRVMRGGAFDGSEKNDATYRGALEEENPDAKQAGYPKVGFRCAKSVGNS